MTEPAALQEAVATLAGGAAQQTQPGRLRIRLIKGDVQGSSGYYPAEVLRRDGPKVFVAGTQTYVNHPSLTESVDRPERSAYDLAGVLTTDASYEGDGLYAEVELAPHHRWIEGVRNMIGMSIRASGTVEPSTVESVRGPIVTAITAAESVDFVTAAGAGGKIVALLESARTAAQAADPAIETASLTEARNIGQWLESRLHLAFTQITDDMFGNGRLSRDERISLSNGIGDALTAFTSRVEADQPQLYTRDLWDGPDDGVTVMSEAATSEPEQGTENEPGSSPAEPIKEGIVPELTAPEPNQPTTTTTAGPNATVVGETAKPDTMALAEAQAQLAATEQQLAEAQRVAERVATLEAKLTEAADRNQRLENDRAARTLVAEALKTSGLPDLAHSRVTESVCRSLPTVEGGVLDTAKLAEAITAAVDAEKAYVAALAEATGAGTPRGMGEQPAQLTQSDVDAALEEAFTAMGMPAEAAKTAAVGR